MKPSRLLSLVLFILLQFSFAAQAAESWQLRDRMLTNYFNAQVERIEKRSLAEVKTREEWDRNQPRYRRELFEMLSLDPLPERTDLKAVVTGRAERETFLVENLHFQSRPGLYVTANLYLPKKIDRPLPTILYLCGHGPVVTNGVSYGNKVTYQHHGAWFARNGYACLILDTLQLGEILGVHHGTFKEGMWWWNSRGYTPAGVEAWNCIRALDYLSTRPEVDKQRFGATGRSGGGAYSWWIAALDDRIKAAAPVAGITDLRNHVIDGCVEGHCDCMYTVNTYGWDYPQVAALVAPRPLLIVNTDSDYIFPLDGVQRTHASVKRIYELLGAKDKLGLVIGPGPHKDTQDLQLPVFRWFNKQLKGEDPIIEMAATKLFSPEELRVFKELPTDALNTNIHESFVQRDPKFSPTTFGTNWSYRSLASGLAREKMFRNWPELTPLKLGNRSSTSHDGMTQETFEFNSDDQTTLHVHLLSKAGLDPAKKVQFHVLDEEGWRGHVAMLSRGFASELKDPSQLASGGRSWDRYSSLVKDGTAVAFFAPRGIGLNAWTGDAKKQANIRRRFMLLGQTMDGMRVFDIRRAFQALRTLPQFASAVVEMVGERAMAANVLLAGATEDVGRFKLIDIPESFRHTGDYLNALRYIDLSEEVAVIAHVRQVEIVTNNSDSWRGLRETLASFGPGTGGLTVTIRNDSGQGK